MFNHIIPLLIFFNSIIINEISGQSILLNSTTSGFQRYIKIKDTLFTFSDHIIEVFLPEQKIYLHFKNGKTMEFLCSTGNVNLDEGVETPEGIFVIQNKARKLYSTQYDSTLMLNWLGFNFNIGFHALEGTSYYRHLGKRVSSHGCIRIRREDSEFLYSNIKIGTPVIIHSGKSARVIAFMDKNEDYPEVNAKELRRRADQNLRYLYAGLYLTHRQKLVISEKNLTHRGLILGDEGKIPIQLPHYLNPRTMYFQRKLFEVIE